MEQLFICYTYADCECSCDIVIPALAESKTHLKFQLLDAVDRYIAAKNTMTPLMEIASAKVSTLVKQLQNSKEAHLGKDSPLRVAYQEAVSEAHRIRAAMDKIKILEISNTRIDLTDFCHENSHSMLVPDVPEVRTLAEFFSEATAVPKLEG